MAPRVRPVELRRTHPDRCCSQWPLATPHQSPIPTSARKIPHPTKLRRALIGAPPAVTLVETAIVPPAQARIIGKGRARMGPSLVPSIACPYSGGALTSFALPRNVH